MEPTSALKEWDAQCQALANGSSALLLRKGGIMETHEGFEVEHRAFLLYPTFLHQNPAELRLPFQPLLRPDPAPGLIHFATSAEVVQVWRIEDLDVALSLEPFQALNVQAIERRFHYRNRPWLHALLLRTSPLATPVSVPETPEMLGCVSWVPLFQPAGPTLAPVCSEAQLQELELQLQARLGPGLNRLPTT
ncbi:DUF1802 family protein [Deinococcus sonorensis]|uniref:DUF1802 family protein n=2 Tax=Deinococcus sonorensis TaxID=309891 RepID=A0AAU7UF95_9DEIO